jgi:polyisoprenoid-binding protein YceI
MIAGAAVSTLLLAAAGAAVAGDTYVVDPVHSYVGFQVKHMMVTNVKGTFDTFEGTIDLDPADPTKSSVTFSIDVASINTKNEKRDTHLRTGDFFDVEHHPQITFKSKRIEKREGGYTAVGDLTIRGVTKEVALPFVLNGPVANPWGQVVIGVEVDDITVDRHDFGVSWNNALEAGGFVVGDEVTIQLQAEAAKQ